MNTLIITASILSILLYLLQEGKSDGFLRLDDVSGSNDLVNAVDTALIMHRVNEDFRRLTKQCFRWKDDNELYSSNNVIEVCKDRVSGVQDEFIPLYFDVTCKRLKNDAFEYKHYGWEKDEIIKQLESDGFTWIDSEQDELPFEV